MPKLALTKFPGGKSYQAKYLYNVFSFVDCSTFIDGCAGAGSVSLNLPEGMFSRVIANDKDSYIYNMWTHFRDPALFGLLKEKILQTDYSLESYWEARKVYCGGYKSFSQLDIAWATVVSHRMSRNAVPNAMFQKAGRLRGGQNECVNAWQSYQKSLDKIHQAAKHIEIWNEDICNIVSVIDDPNTLIYADLPYMFETRNCKMYRTEMPDSKHKKFLKLCRESKAKIVISGRPTKLYEYWLHDWKVDIRALNNNMSHKKGPARAKQPEVIWSNFEWMPK